jgi:hypothetical protein
MAHTFKRGDTTPLLAILKRASITAGKPTPFAIPGDAVIVFNMEPATIGVGTTILAGPATRLIDAITGLPVLGGVRYTWRPTETDVAGIHRCEFELTFADGSIETFPNDGFFDIEILGDIH